MGTIVVLSGIALIICVLADIYIRTRHSKATKPHSKSTKSSESSQPPTTQKQLTHSFLQEDKSQDSVAHFDDSRSDTIQYCITGTGLKMPKLRSGEYLIDLLDIYKEQMIGSAEYENTINGLYERGELKSNPKSYDECYDNMYAAFDLIITKNYTDIFEAHIDTLIRKRKQLITIDDYGYKDCVKWEAEKRSFIKNIVTPSISRTFNDRPGPNFKSLYKFMQDPERTELSEYAFNIMDYKIDELSSKLKEHEISIEKVLTGHDYEHYVASIFNKYKWCSRITKNSGDQGADIIASKDKLTIVVQCKYYSSPVGNKSVQEIYSAKGYYDGDLACVVTNHSYTSAAKSAAAKLGVILLHHDHIKDFLKRI